MTAVDETRQAIVDLLNGPQVPEILRTDKPDAFIEALLPLLAVQDQLPAWATTGGGEKGGRGSHIPSAGSSWDVFANEITKLEQNSTLDFPDEADSRPMWVGRASNNDPEYLAVCSRCQRTVLQRRFLAHWKRCSVEPLRDGMQVTGAVTQSSPMLKRKEMTAPANDPKKMRVAMNGAVPRGLEKDMGVSVPNAVRTKSGSRRKRSTNLQRICGVTMETGAVCNRPLDCGLHSKEDKREVRGRGRDFDEIVRDFHARVAARQDLAMLSDDSDDDGLARPLAEKVVYRPRCDMLSLFSGAEIARGPRHPPLPFIALREFESSVPHPAVVAAQMLAARRAAAAAAAATPRTQAPSPQTQVTPNQQPNQSQTQQNQQNQQNQNQQGAQRAVAGASPNSPHIKVEMDGQNGNNNNYQAVPQQQQPQQQVPQQQQPYVNNTTAASPRAVTPGVATDAANNVPRLVSFGNGKFWVVNQKIRCGPVNRSVVTRMTHVSMPNGLEIQSAVVIRTPTGELRLAGEGDNPPCAGLHHLHLARLAEPCEVTLVWPGTRRGTVYADTMCADCNQYLFIIDSNTLPQHVKKEVSGAAPASAQPPNMNRTMSGGQPPVQYTPQQQMANTPRAMAQQSRVTSVRPAPIPPSPVELQQQQIAPQYTPQVSQGRVGHQQPQQQQQYQQQIMPDGSVQMVPTDMSQPGM